MHGVCVCGCVFVVCCVLAGVQFTVVLKLKEGYLHEGSTFESGWGQIGPHAQEGTAEEEPSREECHHIVGSIGSPQCQAHTQGEEVQLN